MRWRSNIYMWLDWFAWRPIRIERQWIWLETVERLKTDGFPRYRLKKG